MNRPGFGKLVTDLYNVNEYGIYQLEAGMTRVQPIVGDGEMSVKIHIRPGLEQLAQGQPVVEVKGSTVGECLNNLIKLFPDIKPALFADNGKVLDYVDIFVNGQSSYPDELARAVKDGDELHILRVIGGG